MPNLLRHLRQCRLPRLGRDRTGATMIEYCIIIACIAIVVVVAYGEIGGFPVAPLEAVGSAIG